MPVSPVKLPNRWEKFITQERIIYVQLNSSRKHPPKPPSAGYHIQLLQTGTELKLIGGKMLPYCARDYTLLKPTCWIFTSIAFIIITQYTGILKNKSCLSFSLCSNVRVCEFGPVPHHTPVHHLFPHLFQLQSKSYPLKLYVTEQEYNIASNPGIK